MIKRALLLGVGFLGFYFSLAAQETGQTGELRNHTATPEQSRDIAVFDPTFALTLYRPEILSSADSSVLLPDRPALTLLDGGGLPISSLLAEMGIVPLDLFPVASSDVGPAQKASAAPVNQSYGKDSPRELMSSPLDPIYYGGEVGFFYGQWSGKFGGDVFQTYMLGDVGNEKFHIRVGAAYEEWNARIPRFRSFARPR